MAHEVSNLNDFPNIKKLCDDTGLQFSKGEIGFGRPCVGLLNVVTDCYVDYEIHNMVTYKIVAELTVETPEDAYHKNPSLAVLIQPEDYENHTDQEVLKAMEQLEEWCLKINEHGYKIQEYTETGTLSSMVKGGVLIQKAIVDANTSVQD